MVGHSVLEITGRENHILSSAATPILSSQLYFSTLYVGDAVSKWNSA